MANSTAVLYRRADSLYTKALSLSLSKSYSEDDEGRLNRLALIFFQRYFAEAEKQKKQADTTFLFAAIKCGELAHYFDSLKAAQQFYKLALGLRGKLNSVSDTVYFKPLLLGGLIYITQNKLDSAIYSLKQAEKIQDSFGTPLQEQERLYNLLGSVYYEYGNYRQAKNYFHKAAEVLAKNNPSYEALYANYRVNLATALLKLEEYVAAKQIYAELLQRGSYLANEINNNLGLIQLSLGAPRQAIAYFAKVRYQSSLDAGLFNDIANAYLALDRQDSARHFLLRALQIHAQYNAGGLSLDYGRSLKLLGDWQRKAGAFDSALRYYQEALHQFYPAFRGTNTDVNPTTFSGAFSYINLFQTLVAKAETQEALSQRSNRMEAARAALRTYKSAFLLIDYVERTYESDEARLFLTRIKYAVHGRPVNLAFALYKKTGETGYLESLYEFDQRNKAAVLALNRQRNADVVQAMSAERQKERQLKSEITRLSIKAARLKDIVQTDSLGRRIRDLEIALAKLQSNNNNKSSLAQQLPSINELRTALLDGSTALLSYHLSDDRLTTLVITTKKVRCYQQLLPTGFHEQVQQQMRWLKDGSATNKPKRNTALSSLLLHGLPAEGLKQLVIIPDDVLAYFPFESLQDSAGRFLVENFAVQYQHSTALLDKNSTDFAKAKTLAFAPFASALANDSLPALPASAKEIEHVEGKQLLNDYATKTAFLQESGNYGILHLATHAVVNNQEGDLSYVLFAPSKKMEENHLYAREIYNLRLPETDLVILSACETGGGLLVRGEGVLSLTRAFAYAGCANVVTSLWKADDISTAYLTTRLHRYLRDGAPPAAALRQAKRDYLADRNINPRLKHPYYWAHLVFVGNYSPGTGGFPGWWLLGFAAIVCASATFFWRQRTTHY